MVFFCTAIGRDPEDLIIAVVNDEVPSAYTTNNCSTVPGCDFTNLSCRFYGHLFNQTQVMQKLYPDLASGEKAVRDGKAWGVVHTPANFSNKFLKRLWSSIDADKETLRLSSIDVS